MDIPTSTLFANLPKRRSQRPALREKFRNDHLDVWLDALADPWLDLSIYDEGATPVELAEREGEAAWIGVDLGSVSDLTAVVIAFRDKDGGFSVVPFTFAEASLRPRQDAGEAPVCRVARRRTPSQHTRRHHRSSSHRRADSLDLCEQFAVAEIACDPWGARDLQTRLLNRGLPVMDHRQGFISMAAPTKAFETAVLGRKLRHGGHPVLRWSTANIARRYRSGWKPKADEAPITQD